MEEHYASQGLGIVGYFHANERFDDVELGNVAKNIGDHIYRYFPQAPILLVCIVLLVYFRFQVLFDDIYVCIYIVFYAIFACFYCIKEKPKQTSFFHV